MIFINKYKTIYKGSSGEFDVKKSKFIGTIMPASTEEEALSFIDKMKKKYYDANHNCYAYIISGDNEISRFNDDGEPSRTAGMPMLDILMGEELKNVVAVVTRYFGGIHLGTGGLVRAYSDATRIALENCKIIEKQKGRKINVRMDYTSHGKIQYILSEENIPILDTNYTELVDMTYISPVGKDNMIQKKLMEVTAGTVDIRPGNDLYFASYLGKLLLFNS